MAALVNDESYFIVHAWMQTKLKLKGLDRDLYAIIYGFSRDGEGSYHGSIEYLCNLTGYSKQSVIPSLKGLVDKGYIIKDSINKFKVYYKVNLEALESKESLLKGKDSLPSEGKESLHNNKDDNNKDDNNKDDNNKDNNKDNIPTNLFLDSEKSVENIVPPIYKRNKPNTHLDIVEKVVKHFNDVCDTNFRATSKSTINCINARLKEGATYDDFIKVIDYKYYEWGLNPIRFSTGQMSDTYLRPSTLFGPKFDEYLQQASRKRQTSEGIVSVAPLEERSKKVY